MQNIIAKIVNFMQYVYIAWNAYMWNYHVNRARMHDDRIVQLDPEWREKI